MSGSLNLRGDLGKWVAATGTVAATASQSLVAGSASSYKSTRMFHRLSATITSSRCQPCAGFSVFCNNTGKLEAQLSGANTTLAYAWTIVPGQTYHVAFAINATGISYIWLNGVVVASVANIGIISAAATNVQIGWNGTSSSNVLIRDPALARDHVADDH